MLTRFILINTSHAGNVGAAARAMKTMGFDDLVLVAPRWANVLRREETIQRASGALDVLDKCRIVDTLDEALDGMTHLCATAMTPRDFGPPTVAPREHFEALSKVELLTHIARGLQPVLMLKTILPLCPQRQHKHPIDRRHTTKSRHFIWRDTGAIPPKARAHATHYTPNRA